MSQLFVNFLYFNLAGNPDQRLAFTHATREYGSQFNVSRSSIDIERVESRSFIGGFLFLGLIFGLTFTLATAIIIYYKQVSEGMQDQERYDVMQRVGMSQQEVKKAIKSQVLMVFFFPIMVATMHLVFAFPIINKMLFLFGLDDQSLTMFISVVVVISFCLIYLFVYLQTSKVYYQIVERRSNHKY